MGSQFIAPLHYLSYLYIPIDPPYFKEPTIRSNELGLPIRDHYTSGDICELLVLNPDTFWARLRTGYYPEPTRLGQKRIFTLKEVEKIITLTNSFTSQGWLDAGNRDIKIKG